MGPRLEPGHNVVIHEDAEVVDFRNETVLLTLGPENLTVALVSLAERKLDFAPGQEVHVTFVRPDALYRFAAVVVRADEAQGTLTLRRKGEEIARIQRRTHFRMPVRLHARARRCPGSGDSRRIVVEQSAVAVDLSGGGALLRLDEPYQQDDLLELTLFLPDGEAPISALSRVVRVERHEREDGVSFRCGVEFVQIRESDRSRIMRFLFLTQARRGG